MEYDELLFLLFARASLGDGNARWEIIDRYKGMIRKMCRGDRDMEHDIMLSIYDCFDDMIENFSIFLNEKRNMKNFFEKRVKKPTFNSVYTYRG